jgi:hypothetical protein
MKGFHPLLLLAATLLAIGLACSALGGDSNTPLSTATQEVLIPIDTPQPTIPLATVAVTPTKKPAFFVEEFDPGYAENDWQRFVLGKGSTESLVVRQEDDHLLFDLGAEDLYVYYMYTPYTYRNVSIKLNAQNRGRNNNNISLVCHMHDNGSKWYEFSVTNSGLWSLYAMDRIYHFMDGGGANALRQGMEENEYQMVCSGDEITLLVNGERLKTVKATKYIFTEGYVGFNISSLKGYSVLPITVEVNSFEIDIP